LSNLGLLNSQTPFCGAFLEASDVFKAGTSLSKVIGLVDRLSENIDLVLDWRLVGYDQEGTHDPYQATTSKTQQSRQNREMNARAVA
jgi:predicted nucleotidyltransferase component of viral defense system